jgi:hypothetical protein
MDQVRRRIDRRIWLKTRFAFARTVELSRIAIGDDKQINRYVAAKETLLEALAPLTDSDRKIVRSAVVEAAAGHLTGVDLQNEADRMILSLRISL